MTIRDAALGDDPSRARLASAIRAVDAAMAACEAARLALLDVAAPQHVPPPPAAPGDECDHPITGRQYAQTFGQVETFCGACGDQLP